MNHSVGRYVFGLATIASGICICVWHQISNLTQTETIFVVNHAVLAYAAGAIEILGGAALLWPGTARGGAIALGALYLLFALLGVPGIAAHPSVYNGYGNFFELLSFVAAALILYAASGPASPRATSFARIGYYAFGLCVLSFGLEQLFYLAETATLVPKWIPPGQMFWAIATTAAFVLAAIALFTRLLARLAAQLTALMVAGFGAIVWVPIILADSHTYFNWSETTETFAIAGTALIVAEYLRQARPSPRR
ncbi:MAG TPA: hypothetical protein VK760_16370 [Candidatus Acidoferrales bacterium]|jgi:hypothetical protein|nr:hypothetical protein [Candidatus Acidoferrales bacterium]